MEEQWNSGGELGRAGGREGLGLALEQDSGLEQDFGTEAGFGEEEEEEEEEKEDGGQVRG